MILSENSFTGSIKDLYKRFALNPMIHVLKRNRGERLETQGQTEGNHRKMEVETEEMMP